ncbi:unnamed protein product, partial [Rotaria sp. Silwood2]
MFESMNEFEMITNQILMKHEDGWPGDRIFDEQHSPNYCIKHYDEYFAELMSKISDLPITSNELPNISPCVDINHMHNDERCSVQCIAIQHVLSCFHSKTFFGSKLSTRLTSTMKPRCPEGKRFLIIGGGPAGLFMAIQCLLRGHSV